MLGKYAQCRAVLHLFTSLLFFGKSAKISCFRSDQFCWEVVSNCGDTGFALQIIEFFPFLFLFPVFFKYWFFGIIGATIHIGREICCLLYVSRPRRSQGCSTNTSVIK